MVDGFQKLLDWSRDKSSWQQDALRRLIEKGSLTPAGLHELKCVCKVANGLKAEFDPIPIAKPFQPSNQGAINEKTNHVCLKSITDINDINALDDNHSGIEFSDKGLTVIYGNNGSGKSGYSRILRQTCRIRGNKQNILPNIFRPQATYNPQANILFMVNGKEIMHNWSQSVLNPPELSEISIFDTLSAQYLVNVENEVAFRPFSLDLVDRLGDVIIAVKELLENDKIAYQQAIDLAVLRGDTVVGQLINNLSTATNPEDIKNLASFSDEEQKRFAWLTENVPRLITQDPVKLAQNLRAKANKLKLFSERLKNYGIVLSHNNLEKLKELQGLTAKSQQTVDIAASKLFESLPLDGVGGPLWLALWQSAKEYSEKIAYLGKEFPFVGKGESLCVLCQRPLDSAAIARLKDFKNHVGGEIQKKADASKLALTTTANQILNYSFETALDSNCVEDIKGVNPEFAVTLDSSLSNISQRLQQIRIVLSGNGNWSTIPQLFPDQSFNIQTLVTELEGQAIKYEAAADPSKLALMKKELEEYNARQLLNKSLASVYQELSRICNLALIDNCIAETRTNSLTALSNSLTESLVTKVLCDAFTGELQKLGLISAKVKLKKTRSSRGVSFHKIVFADNESAELRDVLSEGEFRCIALAGFLAELASSKMASGIVFDDPVSSLDHLWRNKTARRLAEESLHRQVIVFTHDLVFLMILNEHISELKGNIKELNLTRTGISAGICLEGPPWYGMKVSGRIKALNRYHQELKTFHETATVEEYTPKIRNLYGLLRESWERAIEEVVLNGVVMRFGRGISSRPLKKLTDITDYDYKIIDNAMTKTSAIMTGHDESGAINDTVPEPVEFSNDIKFLADFVKEVRNRRR